MLSDSTKTYVERVNLDEVESVVNTNTNYFMNAWNQARIMENPDAESESMSETARLSREALLLENPDKADMINKYSVYEAPIGDKVTLGVHSPTGADPGRNVAVGF